jgi:hypothetical protein
MANPRRRQIIIEDDEPTVRQIQRTINKVQVPNIQIMRVLRDADVYDTPALARNRIRISEILQLPQQTPAIKAELKRLRGIIADRTYKQRLATNRRRDNIPANNLLSYTPNEAIEFSDLSTIKNQFDDFDGKDITISIRLNNGDRIVKRLRYYKEGFFTDIFDGFLGEQEGSLFKIRGDLSDTLNNVQITSDDILPPNSDWRQVFRENENNSCVIDGLVSLLDETKKNDKTMINKLMKLKPQFPNGMTEQEINDFITQPFGLPIDINLPLPLPIDDIHTKLRPIAGKSFRKLTLINTKENHVEPQHKEWQDIKYDDFEKFKMDLLPKLSTSATLYSVVSHNDSNPDEYFSQYIFNDGIMTYIPKQKEHVKNFKDQYKLHTSVVDADGVNKESSMVDYQFLEFSAIPLTFNTFDKPVQELDMVSAYTSYPYSFAGYLIAYEEGLFSQDQFKLISDIHENEWTTVYWDIQITQMSALHVLFNLPERIVCPTWFIDSVLQEEGVEFVIFRYEVRKSFTMNFPELPKKEYVKLFGKTAQKPRRTNYMIHGEQSQEFFRYIQHKINSTSKTKCNIRASQFEGEDPIYSLSKEADSKKVCPQILNTVSLWCFANVYKVAKSVPIETILGKTLDSIFLSSPISVPPLFKEKGTELIDGKLRHPFFNKSINSSRIEGYSHVEFCPKKYLPISKTFTLTTQFSHVNEDIGAGGSGKTFYRMNQTPIGILALPTHELIDDKKKEYPNRPIITHHHLAGWLCEAFKNVRVAYIDELTQMTQEQKQDIINKNPDATLFFMGDIDAKTGLPFQMYSTLSKYKVENPHYHNTDYRSKDQETKDYKERLRQRLAKEFQSKNYNQYSNMEAILKEFVPTFHELDESLLTLTATRWCCDYYDSKKMNALNSHRVQGKTISDVFQIDLTTMSHQAFYTCVSRATHLSNIRFIKPSNKNDSRWEFRESFLEKLI